MRNLLAIVLVIVVGVGVFIYRRDSASNEIKTQMLLIVDDMDLSPQGRGEVKALVSRFHGQAFSNGLDLSRRHGPKFDPKSYYDEVLRLVIAQLREEGNMFLADKVERLQAFHSLSVTEQ